MTTNHHKTESIAIPIVADTEDKCPHYASDGAAGADVRADISEAITVQPGDTVLLPTGICFEIPEGYEIQVRPRSGLAFKYGVTVLNTPGTIDHDYRGELKVILINHGKQAFTVEPKMRIAQIIVAPVVHGRFFLVEEVAATSRGSGGFGSTGIA